MKNPWLSIPEMVDHLILSGHVLKITLVTVCMSLSYLLTQTGYSQTEQQNFTEPRFGISMQYPTKWTFVPAEREKEEQDYAAGQSASIGTFCPTASLKSIFGDPDCVTGVPIRLGISVYKLEEGTTSNEFYDFKLLPFLDKASKLLGFRMINVETKNINISGLPAIQRIDSRGPDYSGAPEQNKHINLYVVNGSKGYNIEAVVGRGYDTYLPTIQKMIDSIQIK
jgi:hypothetical protein